MAKPFTLKELAAEAKREVSLRLKEYPRLVREKKMTEPKAVAAVAKMEQIHKLLVALEKSDNGMLDQTIPGNI